MFVDSAYQNTIDKVNKIRSYGLSKMLTIPQIAILGDQSSGKSSVLEAITKLSFPRNIETCTRFATQVSMRQSERVEMSAHIDDEPDFNERHRALVENFDVHAIVSEANRILCSDIEISEKVLQITIAGPTLSPLTIIDLPGYINTTIDGQDKSIVQTIRTINTRYIQDSRTIILAVVPANVDLNNIFVLGEAERYDPNNERTIPIVTKPDTVDPDLLPSLIQTLLNKKKRMKLGYLVMKNSSYKDIDKSWDDARKSEDAFFQSSSMWSQVQEARKGRVGVRKFLGELLYSHIKKELPLLKKEIHKLIAEFEKEIADMGSPISDISMAKTKYIECVMKLKVSLTTLLNGDYSSEYINKHEESTVENSMVVANNVDGDDDDDGDFAPPSLEGDSIFVRSSLQKLYDHYNQVMNRDKFLLPKDEITKKVLRYKGDELPGFISFTTFKQIYMETLTCWRNITKQHVYNMRQYLYEAITGFIEFESDPLLKDALLSEFDEFYTSQTARIDDAITNIFTDEKSPFTMNKFYYDTIIKIRTAKVKRQLQQLREQVVGTSSDDEPDESDANYNEQLAVEDLQEQLQSYSKVARKRIVDVVLIQTIERHMIKQIDIYFTRLIALDEGVISSYLLDSPASIARREELLDKVSVLQKSLREL
ncbi:hypothetical protein BGZ99_000746 [Dissophora globulifera]|uniref:Uncharacterized protein n=1 Tax=Dissophora globulifera TaxID=979702 RepID=A0A9P6UL75_9FUNG|nr:hypothetical protein BGZ99_000746 [Dissophora globulifera]